MSSVNKKEIEKFSKMAAEWWDPEGKFKPLHKFNPVRQEYLVNEISSQFAKDLDQSKPFNNLDILDVGCGGGLLCEPLCRLGANVTGIDASNKNIRMNINIDENKKNL